MAGETTNPAECGLKEQMQKRYVDINPAIEFLEGYDNSWGQEFADGVRTALHFIKKLPVADVQEVKHGAWEFSYEQGWKLCSACKARALCDRGSYSERLSEYCPHCGAKMDEEDGK